MDEIKQLDEITWSYKDSNGKTNSIFMPEGSSYDDVLKALTPPTEEELAILANRDLEAKKVLEAKELKEKALKDLTVTTYSGKVFYADTESRVDIRDAIDVGISLGKTSTIWKLAREFNGNKVVEVTIEELREASELALKSKATIIGLDV